MKQAAIPSCLGGEEQQDKRSIEPVSFTRGRPGLTTQVCVMANCLVKVRILPLQQLTKSPDLKSQGFFYARPSYGLSKPLISANIALDLAY